MFFLRGSFHILGSFVLSGSLAQKRVKAPQLPRPAGQTLWQEQSLCKTDKNKTYPLRNNKNNKLCRFTLEFDTVILQSYLKAPRSSLTCPQPGCLVPPWTLSPIPGSVPPGWAQLPLPITAPNLPAFHGEGASPKKHSAALKPSHDNWNPQIVVISFFFFFPPRPVGLLWA